MALSLADELAAFDDQVMGGGGMSLADEFGLDMDMGPDHTAGLGIGESLSDAQVKRLGKIWSRN